MSALNIRDLDFKWIPSERVFPLFQLGNLISGKTKLLIMYKSFKI